MVEQETRLEICWNTASPILTASPFAALRANSREGATSEMAPFTSFRVTSEIEFRVTSEIEFRVTSEIELRSK